MSKAGKINFYLFCALSFFSCGTAMMDYFLVYPSRAIVGQKEFVEYHNLLEAAILPVSVLPFFMITIQNVFLFWSRPGGVSRRLVIISLVCLLLDWASSIFIQIPINLQLNHGKNLDLIYSIMDTNWIRIFLELLQVAIVFVMLLNSDRNSSTSLKSE
jgi:hypothetical protein